MPKTGNHERARALMRLQHPAALITKPSTYRNIESHNASRERCYQGIACHYISRQRRMFSAAAEAARNRARGESCYERAPCSTLQRSFRDRESERERERERERRSISLDVPGMSLNFCLSPRRNSKPAIIVENNFIDRLSINRRARRACRCFFHHHPPPSPRPCHAALPGAIISRRDRNARDCNGPAEWRPPLMSLTLPFRHLVSRTRRTTGGWVKPR